MEEDNVIALRHPGDIADPLTEALRNGARALLAQAVEAEVAEALSRPMLIRYALAHWEGLTRFLDDGRLELDTNPIENAIRPVL